MKKYLSILLVALLVLSSMSIMAVSAAEKPTFSLTDASGKVGDEVTVNLNIANNPGITALQLWVEYSNTDLKLKSVENGTTFVGGNWCFNELDDTGLSKNPFTVYIDNDVEESTSNGLVVVMKFEILEGAKDSAITVYPETVYNLTDVDDVEFEYKGCTVTVEADQPATSDSQPATSDSQPATSDSQPATSDSQPATSDSQPATSDSQPATSDSQPATSDSQPATSDSQPETPDTGHVVTFVTDGHATINVYYTQDYAAPSETNVTTAVSRNKETSLPDSTGEGQVNFAVVTDDGYEIDSVTADANYKNLKGSEDTGVSNIYRLTKVTGVVTVTVTTKAVQPATSESQPVTSESQPATSESQPASSETTPTPVAKTTVTVKAAKTKIYVGASTLVKATVKNGNGTTVYTSSNSKVATVGKTSGKVTAKKAGSVIIAAKNNGVTAKIKITIVKKANTMTVKAKTLTVKAKAKKTVFKKTQAFTIKKAKGTVTFKKVKGDKRVTINKKTGKITVKKGLKKGKTYKVTFKLTAKGTTAYKAKSKTVTVKIKVKK